jgi:NCAIR mutase (PurE)-related protein
LCEIFGSLLKNNIEAFATRVSVDQADAVLQHFPHARHNAVARTLRVSPALQTQNTSSKTGRVMIVTAGTTDLPVAEEARETADWMGCETQLISDIGVAGPQRLLSRIDEIRASDAVVVVAGMEGALPSVVGGHVACPVIAVPTSVGYGAALGGIAPLLGMLNSCAANVTVVNIDAGFKGGYIAGLIAKQTAKKS